MVNIRVTTSSDELISLLWTLRNFRLCFYVPQYTSILQISCPIIFAITSECPSFFPTPKTLSEALLPAIQLCQQQVQQLRSCKAKLPWSLESRRGTMAMSEDSPWIFLGISSETRWSLRCPFRRVFSKCQLRGQSSAPGLKVILPPESRNHFKLHYFLSLKHVTIVYIYIHGIYIYIPAPPKWFPLEAT